MDGSSAIGQFVYLVRYIDLPNLVDLKDPMKFRHFLVHSPWRKLIEHNRQVAPGALLLRDMIYTRTTSITGRDAEAEQMIRTALNPHGWHPRLYVRYGEDIDHRIRSDILNTVQTAFELPANRRAGRVEVVLVSGDGGYLHTIRALKERYRSAVRIHHYSLQEKLNRDYRNSATLTSYSLNKIFA